MTWGSPKMVYFARQANTVGPIKIGCSWSPTSRLMQLSMDAKIDVEFIAAAIGDFDDERSLHHKFASIQAPAPGRAGHPGCHEWYAASPELLAYIEVVRSTSTLPFDDGEHIGRTVAAMRSEGKTYREIGARFGFTKQRAQQISSRYQPHTQAAA